MKPSKIALATAKDADWAAAQMAGSEPWTKLGVGFDQCLKSCRDPEHVLYMAFNNDRPLGFILLHQHGLAGSPYIKTICVAGEERSQGIGKSLVEFAENVFRPKFKHIFLCVSSFNLRARQLYNRLGYQQVGEFKDYIVAGESELLLHKRLQ